ncbi:hypothetical protein LCGC14_0323360 [marine sediment metagenome]|uniref:Uncharacterized protein n=1 Tax=marine sediment metagenome TaxID=412755 RepID=A0A0F9U1D4_9ZZZZ
MAITVTELVRTGPISLDQSQEVRVREFKVETTDADGDNLSFESDVTFAENIPRIGDLWSAHGYQGSDDLEGELTHAEPRDIATEGQLSVHGVRVIRLAESSSGGLKTITFKVTVQYGTKKVLWTARKQAEITTKTEKIFWDLDAIEGPPFPTPPTYLAQCATWSSIIQQPLPPQFPNYGHESVIENGEGTDKLAPQFVLSFQKLVYDPDLAQQRELFDLAATTNETSGQEIFIGENHWLFLGSQGSEVRDDVFDLTLKFAYDKWDHRYFTYTTEQGSTWPVIAGAGAQAVPACRSYRIYPRTDWNPIATILGITL